MTTIPIPGGPTNKQIIDRAYAALGVSDSMFGRTEEEYASAFDQLQAQMAAWPFDRIGWVAEYDAGGRIEEESGVPWRWMNAVALELAAAIGTSIGKVLPTDARKLKSRAYGELCAAVHEIPVRYPTSHPGAGNRRHYW